MPTPMMPHVPTSIRLRGWYMSTIERVKSSALAPSLTRMASGLALMMSRTTLSALWKFIGVGFLARVSAILATFAVFFSFTAFTHSAGGVGPPPPFFRIAPPPFSLDPPQDAGADIADNGGIDANVRVRFLR